MRGKAGVGKRLDRRRGSFKDSTGVFTQAYYVPADMNQLGPLVARGRPREFCVHEALAKALRVFWSKGYEAASLTDLTEAMGITRPSLYAAFGNKESLFRKALELYECEKMSYVGNALAKPTARAVAETMLRGAVEAMTGKDDPHGCLRVIATATCGDEAQSIREELDKRGQVIRQSIVERFEHARAEGDLPAHIDVEGLTDLLKAMLQGISMQAAAGATRKELERIVDTGLAMWPSS
jgi:AcrR family transcriptional regulator